MGDQSLIQSPRDIFLGYREGVKGYKLWEFEPKNILINCDIVFDEDHMLKAVPIKLKTQFWWHSYQIDDLLKGRGNKETIEFSC